MPRQLHDFSSKLALITKHCFQQGDRTAQLKALSAKKSLANYYKRFRGKLIMMQRTGLIAKRRSEEADLIAASPKAKGVSLCQTRVHARVSEWAC